MSSGPDPAAGTPQAQPLAGEPPVRKTGSEAAPTVRLAREEVDVAATLLGPPTGRAQERGSLAGKRIGPYDLISELGAGAMGVVYVALQRDLDRTVALKVLRWQGDQDGERVQRFIHEAQAAARLQHPGIVPIHEVGNDGEYYWFSMEYVVGRDLERFATETRPKPRRSLEIIRDVARALAYAHAQGIIHRDVKPQNILIAADERPRVADFGLAKDMNRGTALTQDGTVLGTPAYMPPEQAMGFVAQIDARSDVYSLGAVLYFLLVGGPPFHGDTSYDIIRQVVGTLPIPVRRLVPEVNPDIETICLKCMEKEPERRYPSAGALADDIDRFLEGRPIAAHPPSMIRRVVRTGRRYWVSGVAVAVAVVAVSSAILWYEFAAVERDRLRMEETRRIQQAGRLLQVVLEQVMGCDHVPIERHAARLAEVDAMFDEVLELQPDNRQALLRRGSIRAQLGRFAEAWADLDALLRGDPGDSELSYWYQAFADWAAEGGIEGDHRVQVARADLLAQALGRKEGDAYAIASRARTLLRAGERTEALATVSSLLADHGDRPEIISLHVGALAANAQWEAALEQADRLLRSRPRQARDYRLRAEILWALDRQEEAAADWRACILLQAEPSRADLERAGAAVEAAFSGRSSQLLAAWAEMTERLPEAALGWIRLARLHRAAGRAAEAEEALRKAEALEPGHPGALVERIWADRAAGRIEDVEARLAQVVSTEARAWPAADWEALVHLLVSLGRPDRAVALLEEGARRRPEDPRWGALAGMVALAQGRDADALARLDAAVKAAPRDPMLLRRRALVHAAAGRWAEAESDLRETIALIPRHGRERFLLALVLWRRDRPEWSEELVHALAAMSPFEVSRVIAAWGAGDFAGGAADLESVWPGRATGDFDRAACGRAIAESRPRLAAGLAALADQRLEKGRVAEADGLYQAACMVHPTPQVWFKLARLACRRSEWLAALAFVEKAEACGSTLRFEWEKDEELRVLLALPEGRRLAEGK